MKIDFRESLPVDAKEIPDFPGYFATPNGEIWSMKHGRPHPLREGSNGRYAIMILCRNGKRVGRQLHRLVLETFRGPCPDGMQARHLNGDRKENGISNLAWGTVSENAMDRVRHGTHRFGETHGAAKLSNAEIAEIRERAARGETGYWMAPQYGINVSTANRIIGRRTWKHMA